MAAPMEAKPGMTEQEGKRKRQKMDDPKSDLCIPQPVLDDKYRKPTETAHAYTCEVKNKKKTSEILKVLSDFHNMAQTFPHLKRVRSNKESIHIVICECTAADKATVEDLLSPYSEHVGPVCVVKVPALPPMTRQQFEESSQYWPVNFHENKEITRLLNGSYFTQAERQCIQEHMTAAVEMAEKAKACGQLAIGAVMVNPATNSVVARAHDLRRGDHPLQHATMVVIDMVARSQGGGMWTYSKEYDFHPKDCVDGKLVVPDEKTGLPYLCTGYHLYITQEPCIMCAMALVHSRIQRVYYGSCLPGEGALGSRYKLHVQDGLNHHYQVFAGVLKERCDQLYQESGT